MTSKSCRGRDVTRLSEYLNDPAKEKKLFAKALMNDGFLASFDGQVEASECVFSYPDSEWYAVYLLDSDGNKYWNNQDQRYEMYFFKLVLSPNKKDAFTRAGTTDISNTDLEGKRPCMISATGTCVMTPVSKAPRELKEPKVPKASSRSTRQPKESPTTESTPQQVDPDVLARLQTLSLNSDEPSTKEQVPREYFEQMKNKMLIVQWMVEKMKVEDLVECIKRGSLSPDDVRRAEAVASTAPEEASGSSDPVVTAAEEAIASMPPSEVTKMFKRITKEDLIRDLNERYPGDKKEGIIELCRMAGKKLEIRQTKRNGPQLFDYNGEMVTESVALDECAALEAERIRQRLLSRRRSVLRNVVPIFKRGKMEQIAEPVQQVEEPMQQIAEYTPALTARSIIDEINAIDDPIARKNAIVELCLPFGYTVQPSKRGVGGITIIDPDGEQVPDNIALEECAGLKAVGMTRFGKKYKCGSALAQCKIKAKIKCSVKKYKGSSKQPQKKYSKSSFGKKSKPRSGKPLIRKSPPV